MKNDNSAFERVEEFKYLGTDLTYHNSIQEEIKNRLKSVNAYYHSAQNLLSSRLLSKRYTEPFCLLFCMSLTLRE
jgi:protein associated with RNAse G/E